MPAAWRVGMGQFIDQHDLRAARNVGVEVHFLERLALVVEPLAGNHLQSVEERLRLFAPMRLDDADHDVVAVLFPGARLLQHLVGLADAGSGADENLEPAGSALLSPGGLEQGLRRRSLVRLAPVLHHQESDAPPCRHDPGKLRTPRTRSCGQANAQGDIAANISDSAPIRLDPGQRAAARSSARLSARTLTRGSPRKPRVRPSTCSSTSWRTRSSGMLRAFATRGT